MEIAETVEVDWTNQNANVQELCHVVFNGNSKHQETEGKWICACKKDCK